MTTSKALPSQRTPILSLYTVRSPLPPAIAVASSGAAINDGFCYFCILQTDISSSAYLKTFADLRLRVPKRTYITKSIQMVESDGPLKVEDQIRRVPILRLLDCKKRRFIEQGGRWELRNGRGVCFAGAPAERATLHARPGENVEIGKAQCTRK